MSDIRQIVADHEAKQAEAESSRQAAQAEAAQKEASLLQLHNERMHATLHVTVRPALEKAAAELVALGYACRVWESNDTTYGLTEMVIKVDLEMRGKRHIPAMNSRGRYSIEYIGDVKKYVINAIGTYNGASMSFKGGHNMPVDSLTPETVSEQFAEFLREALKTDAEA